MHGVFPFGQPIHKLEQQDRSAKRVFVLGVYASAVHARWVGEGGRQNIAALAVASEPEIFWTGDADEARQIISGIHLPPGAGSLELPTNPDLNGPSGRALDKLFLLPLGLTRKDAWLCDLVPHSCMNPSQKRALERDYDPLIPQLGLPAYAWSEPPRMLATEERRSAIEAELCASGAEIIITLGDDPLRWFAQAYGAHPTLRHYGLSAQEYGQPRCLHIAGRKRYLLPLVHPRQAAALGFSSRRWGEVHQAWTHSPKTL